jgi:hypothetical protein
MEQFVPRARVEALRAVATPAAERDAQSSRACPVHAGTIGSRQVPSYVDGQGRPEPQYRDVRVTDARSE